jgi:hypothetical protein
MKIELGCAPWRAPVLVRIGYGASERVESNADAIHYLRFRWPHERGKHYARAVFDCENAVDGLVSSEVAKESFIAAAIEAFVLS